MARKPTGVPLRTSTPTQRTGPASPGNCPRYLPSMKSHVPESSPCGSGARDGVPYGFVSVAPLLSDSPRIGRRSVLWACAALVATQVVDTPPASASTHPKGVVFTTTGATFSPEVELSPSSRAIVRWLDYRGHELARGTRPTIDFGSEATRTVTMLTTFSHVLSVNIGFDADADAGEYGPGATYNKSPESVVRVSGLTRLTQLRQFLAGGTRLGGKLDVSGLTHLRYIECFCAQLTSVNLTGCKRLVRLCVEQNRLTKLDLNPVAASLRDLRAAAQQTGRLSFSTLKHPLARLYHFCVRDQVVTGHPSSSRLPACRELWNWNTGQRGSVPRPGNAQTMMSYGNSYTSVNMSGQWQSEGFGGLDLTDNHLVAVTLTGCRGLMSVLLGGNVLPQSQVDRVLVEVASWNTTGGALILDGTNASPSAAGLKSAQILRGRGWDVTLATT